MSDVTVKAMLAELNRIYFGMTGLEQPEAWEARRRLIKPGFHYAPGLKPFVVWDKITHASRRPLGLFMQELPEVSYLLPGLLLQPAYDRPYRERGVIAANEPERQLLVLDATTLQDIHRVLEKARQPRQQDFLQTYMRSIAALTEAMLLFDSINFLQVYPELGKAYRELHKQFPKGRPADEDQLEYDIATHEIYGSRGYVEWGLLRNAFQASTTIAELLQALKSPPQRWEDLYSRLEREIEIKFPYLCATQPTPNLPAMWYKNRYRGATPMNDNNGPR